MEEMLWRAYADEWAQNPDLAAAWGIDHDFKADFELGFSVRAGGRGSTTTTG